MIVINTVSNERFSLNGIEYLKNFLSFVYGDKVGIYNAYDKTDQRVSLDVFSNFTVNGTTYASAALLQSALLNIIYTRDTLGAVNTLLSGSIVPTDVPTGTDNKFWLATKDGLYPNHGGFTVLPNSIAIFSRVSGAFSISQTTLDLTGKLNVSDIVDGFASSETNKPGSANNDRLLNEKIVDIKNLLKNTLDSSQIGTNYNFAGYYIYVNGGLADTYQRATPLFRVSKGQKVDYSILGTTGLAIISAYDNNGDYIQANSLQGNDAVQTGTWVAGDNTMYVGFSSASDALMSLTFNPIVAFNIKDSAITAKKIKSNSVSRSKLLLHNLSKNKFNYKDPGILIGYYLASWGGASAYGNHKVTGFITIEKGQTLHCNAKANSEAMYHFLFDSELAFLSMIPSTNAFVTASVNGYVKFSLNETTELPLVQIEEGATETRLNKYYNIDESKFDLNDITLNLPIFPFRYNYRLINGSINNGDGSIKIPTGNTGSETYISFYPDFSIGILSNLVGDFIRLTIRFQFISSDYSKISGFFNSFFSGVASGEASYIWNNDTKILESELIIKVTPELVADVNNYGFFYTGFTTSGVATSDLTFSVLDSYYEVLTYTQKPAFNDFRFKALIAGYIPVEKSKICLPSILPICLKLDFNVYTDNLRKLTEEEESQSKIVFKLPFGTWSKFGMQSGKRFNSYSDVTLEEVDFELIQESSFNARFDKKDLKIKVIDNKVTLPKSKINVCCLGDSITEIGLVTKTVIDNFNTYTGGTNICSIGTRNGNGGHYNEGHSGWASPHFVAYGKSVGDLNPLWNTGTSQVDFGYYVTNLNALSRYALDSIDTIDMLTIMLGTNDPGYCTVEQYIANIHTIINKFWTYNPNGIVGIVSIPPMGVGASDKAVRATWNLRLMEEFETKLENPLGTGIRYYMPIHQAIDRHKGYSITGKSRTGEASYKSDGNDYNLHPSLIGSQQLGDALFSSMIYSMNDYKDSL